MTPSNSLKLACGGLLAMAAALGIGRFVYTPILPHMVDALGWSQADAGFVASANFLGYLIGALVAGHRMFAAAPRQWLLIALALSAATTVGMGIGASLPLHIGLRFGGGVASALVIICASTLVLEQLSASGRGHLAALHFAGVGVGVVISAAVVSAMVAIGAGWKELWLASGLIAAIEGVIAAILLHSSPSRPFAVGVAQTGSGKRGLASMIAAYGLFGFGYVITATFLVTIVRQTREIQALEPWIWILFGLAAIPSVPLWQMVGRKVGLAKAYAVACLIEAAGVAASVEWVTIPGVCVSALLLGGTFMGLTALGLMSGRELSAGQPQRAIGLMTASFSGGQMIGPAVAGFLFERTGTLRSASLAATVALLAAAAMAIDASRRAQASPASSN